MFKYNSEQSSPDCCRSVPLSRCSPFVAKVCICPVIDWLWQSLVSGTPFTESFGPPRTRLPRSWGPSLHNGFQSSDVDLNQRSYECVPTDTRSSLPVPGVHRYVLLNHIISDSGHSRPFRADIVTSSAGDIRRNTDNKSARLLTSPFTTNEPLPPKSWNTHYMCLSPFTTHGVR